MVTPSTSLTSVCVGSKTPLWSVADDVAGDDLVIVVAVVGAILEGVLERGVDLVDGGFLVEHGEELGDRSVWNLHALGVALQFAVDFRHDLADDILAAPVECGIVLTAAARSARPLLLPRGPSRIIWVPVAEA